MQIRHHGSSLTKRFAKQNPLVGTGISTPGYDFIDWGASDNSDAVKKGWILKADSIEELGKKILEQKDNGGKMDPKVLAETVARYNEFCKEGEDKDFGRLKEYAAACG